MRLKFLALSILASAVFAGPALAIPKNDVADILGQAAKANPKIFLRKAMNDGGPNAMSFSFLYKGKGYDFSYNTSADVPGVRIMIWSGKFVQPGVSVDWVSDHGADGIVDEGDDGAARVFIAADGDYSPAKGAEWKPYWQKEYDTAFGALRSFLASKQAKVAAK